MDTGRTSVFTSAGVDNIVSICQKLLGTPKRLPAQPCSAGNTIVYKYRRTAGLGMKGGRNPAKIVAIRHYQQGKYADGSMFNGMNASHEMELF